MNYLKRRYVLDDVKKIQPKGQLNKKPRELREYSAYMGNCLTCLSYWFVFPCVSLQFAYWSQ